MICNNSTWHCILFFVTAIDNDIYSDIIQQCHMSLFIYDYLCNWKTTFIPPYSLNGFILSALLPVITDCSNPAFFTTNQQGVMMKGDRVMLVYWQHAILLRICRPSAGSLLQNTYSCGPAEVHIALIMLNPAYCCIRIVQFSRTRQQPQHHPQAYQ